jgi:hypothetical protein
MEKEKNKPLSLEERIKNSMVTFEEAKREQEKNYGVAVKHVEIPGDPEGEEWIIKVDDRTLTFGGANARKKMVKWAEENNGVVVVVEKKTGKVGKVLAGKLVDDIFLKKAAEDEAIAENPED